MSASRRHVAEPDLAQYKDPASPHPLLFVVASALEGRLVPRHDAGVKVVQAGPALQAGERITAATSARAPAGLLSVGFAAGLDPRLPPGTVLLPRHVLQGRRTIAVDPKWHGRVFGLLRPGTGCSTGNLLALDAVVRHPSEKLRLHQATAAVAGDLESGLLAAVASELGAPYLVVRVILDAATDPLPDSAAGLLAPGGAARPLATLAAMLRAPASFAGLIRRYCITARQLPEALQRAWPELINPPPRRPTADILGAAAASQAE